MRPRLQTPGSSPWYRHLRHDLSDPDQFGEAVSGAELRAEFLHRPEGVTRVEQFQSRGWALDFYDARVKARIAGSPPPGWGSIALIQTDAPSRWYGEAARRGLLVFTPPGEVIDGCIVPDFVGIAVHVPPAIWQRCRRLASPDAVDPSHDFGRLGTVRLLPGPCFDRVEARLLSLRDRLSTDSIGAPHSTPREAVAELITELVTLAWECQVATGKRDRQGPRNRARLARRAEEWLRDHLDEPVTIPDVCLALRVSRRELEYAFRQAFDQSPRDFLQALRLNAIHRALRRFSPVERGFVTKVALEHGVTHLGRFSAHYRDLFGESPGKSATARAPRPRPAG